MDAEVIAFAMSVLKKLGLSSLSLNINNLGCPSCRPKYNEALKQYLKIIMKTYVIYVNQDLKKIQ